MKRYIKRYCLKFIIYIAILSSMFLWLIARFGLFEGILCTLLMWSIFILCIPAAHGKVLFAVPLYFVTHKPIHTEVYFWSSAMFLNIFMYNFMPYLYFKTVPTHLLYRILTIPNPNWLIIIVASLGTFYNILTSQPLDSNRHFKHKIFRQMLILVGYFTFLYLSHQEIIILLNSAF